MAYTEICVRSGGDNLNAGTLDGSATETPTTPRNTYQNGSWVSGTRVFTVASGNPSTDGVTAGMYASVYLDGGTPPNVTNYCGRISAVAATTITLTTAVAGTAPTTSGSITLRVGGAWAGPSATSGFPFTMSNVGNLSISLNTQIRVNIKNDQTYAITAAISSVMNTVTVEGYTSAYGDGGRATIAGPTTGASFVLFAPSTVTATYFKNLIFQSNGDSGSSNLVTLGTSNNRAVVENCLFRYGRGFGIDIGSATAVCCEAYDCNRSGVASQGGMTTATGSGAFIFCTSHDSTSGTNACGFAGSNGAAYFGCVADSNTTGILNTANSGSAIVRSVVYNNATGVSFLGSACLVDNTVISTSTTAISPSNSTSTHLWGRGVAVYNTTNFVTTGAFSSPIFVGTMLLTSDPLVAAASGNFALTTTGGGWVCHTGGHATFVQIDPGYTAATTGAAGAGLPHADVSSVSFGTAGGNFIF